jgi:hypothetical protein
VIRCTRVTTVSSPDRVADTYFNCLDAVGNQLQVWLTEVELVAGRGIAHDSPVVAVER